MSTRSDRRAGAPPAADTADRFRRLRTTARVLLVAFIVVVAVIVFTPGPPDASGQHGLQGWLERAHSAGTVPGWITFALIEFLSNVLMFLPLGLLGALALRRRQWLALPACAAASTVIELTQWLFLPDRDGTWHDVLSNTVGAAIGCGLALALLAVLRRRGRSRAAVPA